MSKEWTADEVAQHNTKDDCYVIVHGRVYDVTEYLNRHPGGFNLLFRVAGKDASKDFEGMFHSKKARLILEEMCVGTLQGSASAGGPSATGGFLSPMAIKSGIQSSLRNQSTGLARPGAMPSYLAPSRFVGSNPPSMRPPPARIQPRPTDEATSGPITTIPGDPIHPNEWRRYTLVQIIPLNHNTRVFKFALPKRDLPLSLPLGQHLQVRARIDGEMVVRPYTPISPPWQKGTFDIAIKKYDDGPLSQYIHGLDVGQVVEMKGPRGEFVYTPGKLSTIAMICAGTGVTPMLQVLRGLFGDEDDHKQEKLPKVILVMANRREEDMLFREELDALKSRFPEHIQIHHLLSQPSETWAGHRGRITQALLAAVLPPAPIPADMLLTYCGPTGFEVLVESSLLSLGYPVKQLFKF